MEPGGFVSRPGRRSRGSRRSAQDAIGLEPVGHLFPGVVRGLLAVARAVVGVEAVRRRRIDLELGLLARALQRWPSWLRPGPPECPDRPRRRGRARALSSPAQAQSGSSARALLRWRIDQRAIEGDARLDVAGMWPNRSHTVRPPRQKPMMPRRLVSPPCDFAQRRWHRGRRSAPRPAWQLTSGISLGISVILVRSSPLRK